ncbi:MAG: polysaccharide biosynthesis protein, partial [Oscillospiraceae bacterium]
KAVYPASAMGISKAMMEKIVLAKSREVSPDRTKFCCTRYGNVLCSKGSVIPLWIEQMKSGKPITITEPNMTRFIMSLDEAIDLVLFAVEHGDSGDIWVQKSPACTIGVQAQAVKELFHCTDEIKVIGAREGEKQYETLLSQDECDRATDMGGFYRVSRDKPAAETKGAIAEFHSNNAVQLTVEQVKKKLLTLPYIQAELGARTER